jgi:hypothetical protein
LLIAEFQVRKDDLAKTRLQSREAPYLAPGDILAKVDRFALTANNITYGVVGERIGYWNFFPAPEGYGIIPVWGFANVVESAHPDIEPGERLYGYFPMASHLVMRPTKIREERLIDGTPHRADLPPVYNAYARVNAEPDYDASLDDVRMLLLPLYKTSFCLYDFLVGNKWFRADQVLIVSASSKTAIGLAYALKSDSAAPPAIALTSERNRPFVEGLGLYSSVKIYGSPEEIDRSKPTVIVDMSGDGAVLSGLHRHLGEAMRYTSNVGVTHYENFKETPGIIRERSAMFFAPAHIEKRAREWGPGAFEAKSDAFWKTAAKGSTNWFKISHRKGADVLAETYREVLEGRVPANAGIIGSL